MHARTTILLLACLASCGDDPAGQGLNQLDASPTLPGLCAADAERCTDEGEVVCDGEGTRTCIEISGCLQWGMVVSCAPGSACVAGDDGATCVARCDAPECTVPEARRCAPGDAASFQRCAENDGGCLAWSAPIACPDDETCGQGGTCGASCADECEDGAKRCEGASVVTCGQYDSDDCLEWGGASTCANACAIGACVDVCQDECATDGLKRCDGATVQVCGAGADGCRHWLAGESCPLGTTCSAGLCATECVDECQEDARACEAGGVVTCVQRDADSCRDRSLPVACGTGDTCTDGECQPVAQCQDECVNIDDKRCDASGLAVEGCGQHDADTCREWAVVAQCGASQTCALGVCVDGCADECEAGAVRCRPGSVSVVETCKTDGDGDACSEWVATADCAESDKVCANGACATTCVDECDGAAVCDGNAIVPCGAFDDDDCRDRGTPVACGPTEQCVVQGEARCTPKPAPGHLKISEILYNSPGDDDDTFIEIAGEPGTPLAGFVLRALDGIGGGVYATLALGGTIPADGFFVIAHPEAESDIASQADVKDAFVDLQNGPDSLVLAFGDTTVDALGYGTFTTQHVFRGEGQSAPNVASGHSLARKGAMQDTDNNRNDFEDVAEPTPGTGFLAARTPSAAGDLVITELMIDPKVLADTQGEWIEIHNPVADATWNLEGCHLYSDVGEEHVIASRLLVPPNGFVILGRSGDVGFAPDYVFQGITLANSQDFVEITCGANETTIDIVAWFTTAPNGKSWSVDPSYATAEANDDDEDGWCPAPVDAAPGKDAGTPRLPNPPCASMSGTYTQVAFDSEQGRCDPDPDWQAFSFIAAPGAEANGTLAFEWYSVFCPFYADASEIWIELRQGNGYQEVAHAQLSSAADACAWLAGGASIGKSLINGARATSGVIEGRLRIEGGCPQGVGCGIFGNATPYNCARKVSLSYPY